jgi:hypothetical protein
MVNQMIIFHENTINTILYKIYWKTVHTIQIGYVVILINAHRFQ